MTEAPGGLGNGDESLGATLRRMRQARGVSGQTLSGPAGVSQSTISRIERGVGIPDPEDIRNIARALHASESEIQELTRRAERLHDRMTDWRPTSVTLAGRQKSVAGWEAETTAVRDFQPALIQGLLQTSGYATATLQVFQRLAPTTGDDGAEAAVLAAVSARIRRQESLADRTKTFFFVITESVLRKAPCSPSEMLAQIQRLRDVETRYPNVSITAIPDDEPTDVPALHGFTLFDDTMVVIDIYNTGLTSHGSQDTEGYRRIFDIFQANARPIGPLLDKYEAYYLEKLRPL